MTLHLSPRFLLAVAVGGFVVSAASAETISFKRQALDQRFYAESIAAADFNHDGEPDLVAGPFWFEGPAFTKRTEIAAPHAFDKESYSNAFIADATDIDGDGLPDAIQVVGPVAPRIGSKIPAPPAAIGRGI
jgi:hypothetical protein